VPVGVDTYPDDPIRASGWRATTTRDVGRVIAGAGLPTLFAFEGGYAVEAIGVNVANLLGGHGG
jgi:acetoin utilization deacetylase AcuC-like enzyme